jgi:glycosyltransferase involved in cell wall biosynthesis
VTQHSENSKKNCKNRKQVLFLFANRPLPLHVNMLRYLESTGLYRVEFLYMNRVGSPVSVPLSDLLSSQHCHTVTWPDGRHFPAKVFNRIVMLMLFVGKTLKLRPDVLHAWNLEMLICARVTRWFRPSLRIVFSLQDTTEWMLTRFILRLQRWAYRGVDLLLVTSEGFESQFLRKFSLIQKDREVIYVPNAPARDTFSSLQCRVPVGELVVGYVGAFKGREGIRSLVQAAAAAREKGVDCKVLFAGVGLDQDLVSSYARDNGFVTYLGPYRHEQIKEIYSNVNVLYAVYNQTYDKKIHMPYRLSEGICCGLPIIATEGSHVGEIVKKAMIGVTVELGDVEQLACILVEMCRTPEHLTRMSQNCEAIREQHAFEHYAGRISRGYARVSTAR